MDPRSNREAITRYFTNKPSNAERIGCPERAILVKIGRGELPPADSWYNHLTACPECFREAEMIAAQAEAAKARRWRWTIGAAIAASVIGAALLWRPVPSPSPTNIATAPNTSSSVPASTKTQEPPKMVEVAPKEPSKRSVAVLATLDLRGFAIIRGDQKGSGGGSPRIRPIEQRLNLILPVASEPGPYRIRLLDADLIAAREARGTAVINNGRTLLTVVLDASVKPGIYTLGLQHEGGEWRLYPLEVRD